MRRPWKYAWPGPVFIIVTLQ
uniref:Uncharacterized protein n=1 Tax=Anguilla anguilla TaxID=7936 RepID=A0A0E9U1D5_ANGAN